MQLQHFSKLIQLFHDLTVAMDPEGTYHHHFANGKAASLQCSALSKSG